MFKKIYIEITNICNLDCYFCEKSFKEKREMSLNEFEVTLKNIDHLTNYVYLHIKGEPTLHSNFDQILRLCKKYNKIVNLTTNGTLLKKQLNVILNNADIIRQINISVHSFFNINSYLDEVIEISDYLLNNTNIIISLRLWNIKNNLENENNIHLYERLINKYNIDKSLLLKKSIKIKNNLFVNKDNVWEWPKINNTYYNDIGTCYGTIDHIGILSDGTVVPCCLDMDGFINLGNIFNEPLNSIIGKEKFQNIHNGFKCNKKIYDLCKHCNFLEEKNK